MKTRVEHDFVRDEYRIWIVGEWTFEGRRQPCIWRHRQIADDVVPDELPRWIPEPLDEHAAAVEPSITMPTDFLAAIVAEGSEVLPPDVAQGRHLADTIAVRDRLLTLVEESARRPADGLTDGRREPTERSGG